MSTKYTFEVCADTHVMNIVKLKNLHLVHMHSSTHLEPKDPGLPFHGIKLKCTPTRDLESNSNILNCIGCNHISIQTRFNLDYKVGY